MDIPLPEMRVFIHRWVTRAERGHKLINRWIFLEVLIYSVDKASVPGYPVSELLIGHNGHKFHGCKSPDDKKSGALWPLGFSMVLALKLADD